jgi:hypothetical protein
MRKLLLGFGLLAVSRYLGGHRRPGLLGLLAPQSLLGVMLAGAAGELLNRRRPRHAAPPQSV